jgi:putative FmdB family regulatory protein
MPDYEFYCNDCHRLGKLFFTYAEYDAVVPICPHCGSDKLKRVISRVALVKSEDSRLDSLDPENLMAGVDEDDPRSLGRFMRKMNNEMGEDMGEEFNEVVERLESGESPDSIEKTMPDLADGNGSL